MKHFVSHTHPSPENPVVLLPKDYFSRVSFEVLDMWKKWSDSSVASSRMLTSLQPIGRFSLLFTEGQLWYWDQFLPQKLPRENSYCL